MTQGDFATGESDQRKGCKRKEVEVEVRPAELGSGRIGCRRWRREGLGGSGGGRIGRR